MKTLYLEERVALARRIVNEKTKRFEALLPAHDMAIFRETMHALLAVLDGGADRLEVERWLN